MGAGLMGFWGNGVGWWSGWQGELLRQVLRAGAPGLHSHLCLNGLDMPEHARRPHPCVACERRSLKPIFNSVVDEYKGKIHYVEVDIEADPEIAEAAGVTGGCLRGP